jgi:hypothetical protein
VEEIETPTQPHYRERAVNRRVQGDIGEASAAEWLSCKGALVWIPTGHSPDVDLMAEWDDRLLRVQVKTSTLKSKNLDGGLRWRVAIATNGGNRSWSGLTKKFDPTRVDYLFVLVGDGRRWFIPAEFIEGARTVALGGTKYSEFEVERGTSFEALIYPKGDTNRIGDVTSGGVPERSNGLDCKSSGLCLRRFESCLPHLQTGASSSPPQIDRESRSSREVLLRPKRQATIPKEPCEEAGLEPGDRLRVQADGPGRLVLTRIDRLGMQEPPI